MCRQGEEILYIKLGRGRAKARYIEPVDQLAHIRLQFHRIRRPKTCHQAQQRHRLHPPLPHLAQAERAKAFGQGFPLRPGQQGMMGKLRGLAAQRFDDLNLRRRIGDMVRPAHHMGHTHLRIIHNRGERVKNLPIRLDQHRVADAGRIDGNVAQNAICPFNPRMIQLEPPDPLPALRAQRLPLRVAQRKRSTVINRRAPHIQLLLALQIQLHRRFKRLIEAINAAQMIRCCGVAIKPRGLPLDPVPMQAQPGQIFPDPLDIFFLGALRIGVVNAQDEFAPRLPGNQEVHQGGAQVSDMNMAGWRRSETGGGHGHPFRSGAAHVIAAVICPVMSNCGA